MHQKMAGISWKPNMLGLSYCFIVFPNLEKQKNFNFCFCASSIYCSILGIWYYGWCICCFQTETLSFDNVPARALYSPWQPQYKHNYMAKVWAFAVEVQLRKKSFATFLDLSCDTSKIHSQIKACFIAIFNFKCFWFWRKLSTHKVFNLNLEVVSSF